MTRGSCCCKIVRKLQMFLFFFVFYKSMAVLLIVSRDFSVKPASSSQAVLCLPFDLPPRSVLRRLCFKAGRQLPGGFCFLHTAHPWFTSSVLSVFTFIIDLGSKASVSNTIILKGAVRKKQNAPQEHYLSEENTNPVLLFNIKSSGSNQLV